ncbi:sister chromatid cohesion protein DCC1 [Cylas formicarius]|uniref:sister chromatid cohesion protein DCC1 n=1 Tax=Cylas formicarius TaxID=197179 RepID=UPI002958D642|nr:sister chromatid cohesion protein DCC1 [Cylas formicarius]
MESENPLRRDLNEINEILKLAKLREQDVMPTAQTLFFADDRIYNNEYRLLELNPELLKAIEEKQPLCIKGSHDEDVVICSENITFHVVEAETSNSLLLVEPLKFAEEIKKSSEHFVHKVEIASIFHNYLEAIVSKPYLRKLYQLLNETVYKGPEREYEIDQTKLYSLSDLKEVIQASNMELQQAIESMDTVVIEGNVRVLDFEYHFRVLSYMLKLIDSNSWPLDQIDYDVTIESLAEIVPTEVVSGLFEKYTEASRKLDHVQLYRYKEDKVCQFFAKVLLREADGFNLNDFLQAWGESVPEGMVPNEEMLYGIAIIDRKSNPNIIWALEESNLPEDVTERFNYLFDIKEKWSVPEITPYIRRLATDKIDVNALLAKHARASRVDGVKYYSAKHLK